MKIYAVVHYDGSSNNYEEFFTDRSMAEAWADHAVPIHTRGYVDDWYIEEIEVIEELTSEHMLRN